MALSSSPGVVVVVAVVVVVLVVLVLAAAAAASGEGAPVITLLQSLRTTMILPGARWGEGEGEG